MAEERAFRCKYLFIIIIYNKSGFHILFNQLLTWTDIYKKYTDLLVWNIATTSLSARYHS